MRALEGLPEVESVRFAPSSETFTLKVRQVAVLSRDKVEQTIVRSGGERTYEVRWRSGRTSTRGLTKKALPFKLPTLRGGEYDFGSVLTKKPAVLVFWASWCTACIEEAPVLSKLHEKYGERVEMVSVSIDAERDHGALRRVVDELQIPYPVALDVGGNTIRAYTDRGAIPLTLFIDGSGAVVDHAGNFEPGDERRLVMAVERIAN